jgi:hypothetical protein
MALMAVAGSGGKSPVLSVMSLRLITLSSVVLADKI